MAVLFIGGPADGEWREIGDLDFVEVLEKGWRPGIADMSFKRVGYTQRPMVAGKKRFNVMALDGVPDEEVMEKLIMNYRPKEGK